MAPVAPLWNELTGVERAKIVRLLVDRVTCDRTEGTVSIAFRRCGMRELARGAAG